MVGQPGDETAELRRQEPAEPGEWPTCWIAVAVRGGAWATAHATALKNARPSRAVIGPGDQAVVPGAIPVE